GAWVGRRERARPARGPRPDRRHPAGTVAGHRAAAVRPASRDRERTVTVAEDSPRLLTARPPGRPAWHRPPTRCRHTRTSPLSLKPFGTLQHTMIERAAGQVGALIVSARRRSRTASHTLLEGSRRPGR